MDRGGRLIGDGLALQDATVESEQPPGQRPAVCDAVADETQIGFAQVGPAQRKPAATTLATSCAEMMSGPLRPRRPEQGFGGDQADLLGEINTAAGPGEHLLQRRVPDFGCITKSESKGTGLGRGEVRERDARADVERCAQLGSVIRSEGLAVPTKIEDQAFELGIISAGVITTADREEVVAEGQTQGTVDLVEEDDDLSRRPDQDQVAEEFDKPLDRRQCGLPGPPDVEALTGGEPARAGRRRRSTTARR